MTIVDTHCHIGLHKYELVESLLYHMNTSGVDRAVFIQYAGNSDNQYMINSMAAHPGKFQAAMIVPPTDDGTAMRQWTEHGIVGIRLPANSRADCAAPLAQWRTAAELDLVVSATKKIGKDEKVGEIDDTIAVKIKCGIRSLKCTDKR